MTILHYFLGFPPFHSGGLMIYARDLAKQQLKNGNNVLMLMPGKFKHNKDTSKIKYFGFIENISVYQIVDGLPFSLAGIKDSINFMREIRHHNYDDFLTSKSIEVIHVHSLIGLPKEFLQSAKKLNIKIFFTSHDYFGLCPQINLFNYENKICIDYKDGVDCVKCNEFCNNSVQIKSRNRQLSKLYPLKVKFFRNATIRLMYDSAKSLYDKTRSEKQVLRKPDIFDNHSFEELKMADVAKKAKEYESLRKYYLSCFDLVDVIIFNSSVALNVYNQYIDLKNWRKVILPITHGNIYRKNITSQKISNSNHIHFAFLGYLDKKKGFDDLMQTLNVIKNHYTNWEITIYGDNSKIDMNQFDKKFFTFKGSYEHSDLVSIFSNIDFLVFPSKCKETFGFTGLEAISFGIPVIASNNVGFTDLIENNITGLVYNDDVENLGLRRSIESVLEDTEIVEILKKNLKLKKYDFSIKEHADLISKVYRS